MQWPQARGAARPATRFFADGGFYTPDRKARFVPVAPFHGTRTSEAFPLVLNTGRIRDRACEQLAATHLGQRARMAVVGHADLSSLNGKPRLHLGAG